MFQRVRSIYRPGADVLTVGWERQKMTHYGHSIGRNVKGTFGQKRSFLEAPRKGRLQIRKRTIESIAATRNNFFVGCFDFAIPERKQFLVLSIANPAGVPRG